MRNIAKQEYINLSRNGGWKWFEEAVAYEEMSDNVAVIGTMKYLPRKDIRPESKIFFLAESEFQS